MDISIIIVNYKVRDYIVSCIDSIYKHSSLKYKFEIIVIDNCSNDGSIEAIKDQFPEVSIIKNNINIGFAKAANQGAEIAKGKFFLILNPDTLFIEDTLFNIMSSLEEGIEPAVIGPMLLSEFKKLQQSFWKKPTLINTILSLYHLDILNYKKNYSHKRIDEIFNVDSISGAVFFTQSKIFKLLRGFNENLFWMEDIDYCVRAKKLGYKIYYLPKVKVIHYQGRSIRRNIKVALSNQLLSKIKFFKIHHSRVSTFILFCAILFISIIKSILFLIISPFNSVYREKMMAYLYAIYSICLHLIR